MQKNNGRNDNMCWLADTWPLSHSFSVGQGEYFTAPKAERPGAALGGHGAAKGLPGFFPKLLAIPRELRQFDGV
jgi:hypothetical protein